MRLLAMTKEERIKLAQLRNAFGSVYSHITLNEEMDKMQKEDPEKYESIKEAIGKILKENEIQARSSIKYIKRILDSFG